MNISYSQNFIKSSKLVEQLISKTNLNSQDTVYEIGPGEGIITQELAKVVNRVIAIELDEKLYKELVEKFRFNKKVELLKNDFLKFNLPQRGDYKIFSNIPFNMTAGIVGKITRINNPPIDAYLIIQKEAALKFSGQPYCKNSQYSLLLKPVFELKIITEINRNSFYPRPKVNAVLLWIQQRKNPLIEHGNMSLYRDFIVYGFNQWKPTLKEALKKIFTELQLNRLFRDLNIKKDAKPTNLDFHQWLGMFNYFLKNVTEHKKRLVFGSYNKLRQYQSKLHKVHRTRKVL